MKAITDINTKIAAIMARKGLVSAINQAPQKKTADKPNIPKICQLQRATKVALAQVVSAK